jgi:hypothetical protein
MLFKQSGVTKGHGTSQVCFLPSNMPRIWQKLLPTNNSVDGSCGTEVLDFNVTAAGIKPRSTSANSSGAH